MEQEQMPKQQTELPLGVAISAGSNTRVDPLMNVWYD